MAMDKKLKRMLTSFKSRGGGGSSSEGKDARTTSPPTTRPAPAPQAPPNIEDIMRSDDTIEGNVARAINAFITSGGADSANPEAHVLYLPLIVDLTESSPSACAAALAALTPHLPPSAGTPPTNHYNALMLLRILSDNPGHAFTRNLGASEFLGALKTLIRRNRDGAVWTMLLETLTYLSGAPADACPGLAAVRELWARELAKINRERAKHGREALVVGAAGREVGNRVPAPAELASRLQEARTSAGVLEQMVVSTAAVEVPAHELIVEFVQRCRLASRSIQGYLAADEGLDEDTVATLIETNEVLSEALEKHRVAHERGVEEAERRRRDEERAREEGAVESGVGLGIRAENPFADPVDERPVSPISPMSPPAQQVQQPVQYRF